MNAQERRIFKIVHEAVVKQWGGERRVLDEDIAAGTPGKSAVLLPTEVVVALLDLAE